MREQVRTFFLVGLLAAALAAEAGEWPYRQELNSDVQFWIQVFTRYHTNQYIVHDSENLEIVYRLVTFDSTIKRESREKQMRRIKKEIERTLFGMARKLEQGDTLTAFERYIQKLLGKQATLVNLRMLSHQVRVQQGMRETFREGVRRSLAYLPYLRKIFQEEDLPEELCYLPHVESSFNIHARSRVGAVGMWQFMRSTGRLYMKVNRTIDQRRDPFVSTRAAARLLKYNYQELGDWALALTAYNFGVAGIRKAKKRVKGDYLKIREEFRHRRFGFASRNFYPEFLAVVEIMRHREKYFPDVKPIPLPRSIEYRLKRAVKLPNLARRLNIPLDTLKQLNPAYTHRVWRGWNYVPRGYTIRLPMEGVDFSVLENYVEEYTLPVATNVSPEKNKVPSRASKAALLASNGDKALAAHATKRETAPAPPALSHQLALAETGNGYLPFRWSTPEMILLAPELKTSKSPVKASPSLSSHSAFSPVKAEPTPVAASFTPEEAHLRVRTILQTLTPRLTPQNSQTQVFIHETLGHFAEWLQIPLSRLRRLNGLGHRSKLYLGQNLQLDFSRVSPERFLTRRLRYHEQILKSYLNKKLFVNFIEYEVNSGESVWEVARSRYGVPFELVAYLNAGLNLSEIKAGDVVKIPIMETKHTSEETL